MAIRIQNLPKKGFDQGSALPMPHFGINYPPWCVTGKQQMPLSLFNNNNNVTAKSESPSQNNPEVKPLGFQLMEQDSSSTQSLGNSHSSHQDISAAEGVNSQDLSVSSESGQDESCGRSVDGQMKPVFLYSNESDFMFNPSQADQGHPMVHVPYAPADPYLGGLMTTYGPQAIIQPQMGNQIIGMAPNRVPLPLNLAEDGPIYVNAKQYHGILRRRQSRAKLEAQNKLVKTRKPYLHESRHLHALKRVRGSGGRFLSTKKLQQANLTSQQKDGSGQDSHQIRGNDRFAPSSTCSDVKSVSNRDSLFLQSERGISGFSGAMGSAGQLNGDLLFGASGHRSSSVR